VPNAGKALIGDPTRRMLWKSMAAFVQDDYRMNEKLTLNLGLRYEIKTPIREAANPKRGRKDKGIVFHRVVVPS